MAGGIFSSMNKIRPGAYINFEGESQVKIGISSRGIATLGTQLSWGEGNKLIELTGADLLNNNSLAKIGLSYNDEKALLFKLALQNCNKLLIKRLNAGGTKASVTLSEGLKITAKYAGAFGNKIAILIKQTGDKFTVETYANGYFVDSQKISAVTDLVSNDFVDFGDTGTLAETNSTLLTGGDDEVVEAETYAEYFKLLKNTKWNTLAVPSNNTTLINSVIEFIKDERENEGKYVQAVVANSEVANYEGIINVVNGVVLNDNTTITAEQFTAWVAGATAGADITESLTGKIVTDAISIIGLLSNEEIIDALNAGKFVLSLNQNGSIKVEKDINSLHTLTADKGYIFTKNRVIRELDEIGSSIENIWETTYLGKVSNNDNGRTLFKASIITYLTELQNKGAINEFDSNSIIVEAGDDIDSVIASIAIKPVDSMEFLYMTINVEQ